LAEIEVAVTGWRRFLRPLLWLLGAAAVALLLSIFIVALPIALAWRAILEVTVWRRRPGATA
jgi:hypothetical protein